MLGEVGFWAGRQEFWVLFCKVLGFPFKFLFFSLSVPSSCSCLSRPFLLLLGACGTSLAGGWTSMAGGRSAAGLSASSSGGWALGLLGSGGLGWRLLVGGLVLLFLLVGASSPSESPSPSLPYPFPFFFADGFCVFLARRGFRFVAFFSHFPRAQKILSVNLFLSFGLRLGGVFQTFRGRVFMGLCVVFNVKF